MAGSGLSTLYMLKLRRGCSKCTADLLISARLVWVLIYDYLLNMVNGKLWGIIYGALGRAMKA